MTVVTTAYPLFEMAAGLGGGRVHAHNLLPLDPFATLTADQVHEIQTADLVITLGRGVQPSVDAALQSRTKPVMSILDFFPNQTLPGTTTPDPYVWENPQNMVSILQRIYEQYVLMDGDGKQMYTEYLGNLAADYSHLDLEFSKTLATCKSKDVVSEDNRFKYLTDRYGLRYVMATPDTLATAIGSTHATTVFLPSELSLDAARDLNKTYGVTAATMDPAIAQTDQARRGGSNYGAVMDLNLDALKAALQCSDHVSLTD
jgi:zinc transport system substrate-binding protein